MADVEKSARYWPEIKSETFGRFEIQIKKKQNIPNLDGTILRSLEVKGFTNHCLLVLLFHSALVN
jgi:hypothetical protein